MAERLEGTVEHVVFQNSETGYAVVEVLVDEEYFTAVGPLAGICEGEEISAEGEFVNHASFGKQFKVTNCEYRLPETASSIEKYLAAGTLPGVGAVVARRIVDEFGADTFNVISNTPNKLSTIKGLNPSKAMKIHNEFNRIFGIREAVKFLGTMGISSAVAIEVYKHYGELTAQLISENPFLLCAYPAFMPFEQIDRFAAEEQMDKEGDNRIGAGILYIMRHNLNNGHTCVPVKKFLPIVQTFLDVDEDKIEIMLMRLQDSGEIIKVPLETVEYFYLPEFYRAEIFTANRIAALMKFPIDDSINIEKSIAEMETKTDITYAPLQKKAIAAALQNNAIVLTGGPGTGKTTTVNAIISLLEGYCDKVLLAAPTGRAAKRLSELTGKKATTIHRLLEVDFKTVGDEISFIHNSRNRLKCDAVIIDEMSMVDALLFENLLDALKENCRLILVGDVDQLPSVGAGNVLKGIIDSKVMPVICLKEVFRQAAQSLIVSNAHRIVKGEMPVAGAKTDDFFMIEANALGTQQLVLDLVCDRLPKSYNFSPINDIQVLCPSKIGATGTVKLNELLQERLNPKGSRPEFHWGEQSYREGDKVMQIKNNYDIQYQRDDGECGAGAFNGDIGVIESVNAKASEVKVRFDDRVYVYTTEFIRQLELAYAVTIHKSQGSEFTAVVLPVSEVPGKLCYRNLLYTGVTRAKQLLVVPGQGAVIEKMIKNDKRQLRFSCLSQFINDEN